MAKMLLKLTLCIVVAVGVLCGFTHGATPVRVQVSGRNLPLADPLNGSPDAYLVISYAYGVSEQFETVGKTSAINDDINPNWPEFYDFAFVPGASQRLRFEVWDEDFDSDDYIGDVEFFLAELSNVGNGALVKAIQPAGNGNLIISNLPNATTTTSSPSN